MLIKWGIAGAICGGILGIFAGGQIVFTAIVGAAAFVAFRKWVLKTFWQ